MSDKQADREALLEMILTRAAEQIGDLTAPTMYRFYNPFPDALSAFEHHACGAHEQLEAEMVATALFAVTTWVERSVEVEIMLHGSVPHHCTTATRFTSHRSGTSAC